MTNWDSRFLALAKLVSGWSKDPSTQIGAVIVGPDNGVISVGFNGFPRGMSDDPTLYNNRDEKYSRIVHAEVNALLYAGRPIPEGCTLYTFPLVSCDRCVVQMLQAGIKKFVAPVASGDKLERWGEIFQKTRKYISECGGTLLEIEPKIVDTYVKCDCGNTIPDDNHCETCCLGPETHLCSTQGLE